MSCDKRVDIIVFKKHEVCRPLSVDAVHNVLLSGNWKRLVLRYLPYD